MELELEELEASAAEDAAAVPQPDADSTNVHAFTRRKPVRGPLPAHLPRERVVLPGPAACPCCGGALAKLGETITETLEVIPRQWKVVQTVREKFTCRACETITQPPAPFHPISRGRAGPNLLAMLLDAKFANHLPLNRQSEAYAREGIDLDVSTLADWVGACTATLAPLFTLIRAHVMAAERLHGDDTTVPVLARGKTITGRLWTYVRDDRPFGGPAPPAAIFHYSRDRGGEHPQLHLAGYRGVLQADAYAGFNDLYAEARQPAPLIQALCWRMHDATSSNWRNSPRRHWRSRRSVGSTRSSTPSAPSMVCRPTSVAPCGRSGSPFSWTICRAGCVMCAAGCHAMPMWRRRSTIC
jgi:transposase